MMCLVAVKAVTGLVQMLLQEEQYTNANVCEHAQTISNLLRVRLPQQPCYKIITSCSRLSVTGKK